jgi:hypothetical protein
MAEFDTDRTYALPRLVYALCNPAGQPLSLHGSVDIALGAWYQKRGGIIIDEKSRQRAFSFLLREKYSIRRAHAWCRVTSDIVLKLPKEKPNVKPQIKRKRPRS